MTSALFAMPADWDDSAGWESYHAGLYPSGPFREARSWLEETATMIGPNLVQLLNHLRQRQQMAIWFPGCGLDPLPRLFAEFGFDVHATDIAPTAVRFQEGPDNDIAALKQKYQSLGLAATAPGKFTVALQDLRVPHATMEYDLILNFKSFQGFGEASMRRIASAHKVSLKPSRSAYFDTMNVQGERRDLMERVLVEEGFHIPGYQALTRMRQALRDTGIPHAFILGQPMVPRYGAYANDEAKAQRDTARLREIFAAHLPMIQAAYQEDASSAAPDTRTAVVIYNTG